MRRRRGVPCRVPQAARGGRSEANVSDADLQRVAGTYRSEEVGADVAVEPLGRNRIRVRFGGGDPVLFVATSPTRFRAEGLGSSLILDFRLTGDRATSVIIEETGQPNHELTRVP